VPPVRPEVGGAPLVLPSWLDALSERWWARTPRARALALLTLAVLAAVGVSARLAASPYGPPVPVLVATSDLPVGTVLGEDHVRTERWPGDLVPDDGRDEPVGTLTAPLPAGAVLTTAHVTDDGLAGMLAPGQAAAPLPADLVPHLSTGTEVQVVTGGTDGVGVVLADRAAVIADDGTSLWLAVPVHAAADVAAAGSRGTVSLVVLPPEVTRGTSADP
jgi:hypothetical protein